MITISRPFGKKKTKQQAKSGSEKAWKAWKHNVWVNCEAMNPPESLSPSLYIQCIYCTCIYIYYVNRWCTRTCNACVCFILLSIFCWQECKMTFRYGERSYVESNHLINADRTCGTLLSHELLLLQWVCKFCFWRVILCVCLRSCSSWHGSFGQPRWMAWRFLIFRATYAHRDTIATMIHEFIHPTARECDVPSTKLIDTLTMKNTSCWFILQYAWTAEFILKGGLGWFRLV